MRTGVTGAKDTARAFRELARYVATPSNEACRYALGPTLSEARKNAPKKTGELRRSLAIRRDPESPKSRPRFLVGPRRGSPAVRYAHLVEFFNDGPGKGFFTAAFEATKDLVVRRFNERIGPAIEKRAAKLAAKARR
jgi:hypothetical protein